MINILLTHTSKTPCNYYAVSTEIDLVSEDATGRMSVQVNCSHNYIQPIFIIITVQQNNSILTSTSIFCEHESNHPFDVLKCDTSYDLLVSWMSNSGVDTKTNCTLNQALNRMISCSGEWCIYIVVSCTYGIINNY